MIQSPANLKHSNSDPWKWVSWRIWPGHHPSLCPVGAFFNVSMFNCSLHEPFRLPESGGQIGPHNIQGWMMRYTVWPIFIMLVQFVNHRKLNKSQQTDTRNHATVYDYTLCELWVSKWKLSLWQWRHQAGNHSGQNFHKILLTEKIYFKKQPTVKIL